VNELKQEINNKHFTENVKSVTNFLGKYKELIYVTREVLVTEIRLDVETKENLGPFMFTFFFIFITVIFILFILIFFFFLLYLYLFLYFLFLLLFYFFFIFSFLLFIYLFLFIFYLFNSMCTLLNTYKFLPYQLCNFDETSLLVKKSRKGKVYIPVGMKQAGVVVNDPITSTTLFLCVFLDGTPGPNFLILPKTWELTKNIKDRFSRNFNVR
jgi:membrane-associated HD superfamily phosphohydrolase